MLDKELWERLRAYPFDAPQGTEPFSVKLANAEGWSKTYTEEVIEEYRKFLYLSTVSKLPITPSIAVDRAWHMHLTFTRQYWDVLCKQVLRKELHHDPCAGSEEMPRYHKQYADTCALYRLEFGQDPPASVWGGPPVKSQMAQRDRALYAVLAGGFGSAATVLVAQTPWSWMAWVICLACLAIAMAGLINILSRGKRYGSTGGAGCGTSASNGAPGKAGSGWFGTSDGDGGGAGCGGGGCGGGGG